MPGSHPRPDTPPLSPVGALEREAEQARREGSICKQTQRGGAASRHLRGNGTRSQTSPWVGIVQQNEFLQFQKGAPSLSAPPAPMSSLLQLGVGGMSQGVGVPGSSHGHLLPADADDEGLSIPLNLFHHFCVIQARSTKMSCG